MNDYSKTTKIIRNVMKLKKSLYGLTASAFISSILSASVSAAEATTIKPTAATPSQSKNSQAVTPFVVTKGKAYAVCNDVAKYVNEHRAFFDTMPREFFPRRAGKFSKPKKKPSTFNRYIQVAFQALAYIPIPFDSPYGTSWKSIIKDIEEKRKSDLAVTEFIMDINNDGVLDKVLSASYLIKSPYHFWSVVNYVLNDEGNINLAFKDGRVSTGELFYYDGHSFRYSVYDDNTDIHIYENFPMYRSSDRKKIPENMTGLRNYPAVCGIQSKKNRNN